MGPWWLHLQHRTTTMSLQTISWALSSYTPYAFTFSPVQWAYQPCCACLIVQGRSPVREQQLTPPLSFIVHSTLPSAIRVLVRQGWEDIRGKWWAQGQATSKWLEHLVWGHKANKYFSSVYNPGWGLPGQHFRVTVPFLGIVKQSLLYQKDKENSTQTQALGM